jgi:hypothetical protein
VLRGAEEVRVGERHVAGAVLDDLGDVGQHRVASDDAGAPVVHGGDRAVPAP